MTREELEALIDAGNIEECVKAFEGMPEASRLKLGSAAVARLKEVGKGIPSRMAPFLNSQPSALVLGLMSLDDGRLGRFQNARAAVLATASFSQWKGVRRFGLPSDEMTLRILRERQPPWLGELVEFLFETDSSLAWSSIRALVREGLCPPPRSGRYIDAMLNALPAEAWRPPATLKEVLLADSGHLDHEIWRIFETEPGPRFVQLITAGMQGVRPEATWEVALVDLANEGQISRERLLDATLDGLSRDLHDLRAKFFALVHDRLKPAPAEMAMRSQRYLDFLGSRNPSTIAFALKVLKELMKAGTLDHGALIDRLAPALSARTKGTVKQALALLDMASRGSDDPATKARAVVVAVEGLVHEAADIQEAVLAFLERHGDPHDPALRELMLDRIEGVAASLRGRLEAWLGVQDKPEERPIEDDLAELERRAAVLDPRLAALAGVPEALAFARGERADLPALTFDGTEIPRLDPARRLEPINDLDALIELCSRLIENPEPAEDIDRCVDAISRLCDQRPGDLEKLTAPLAARVRQRLGAQLGFQAYAVPPLGVVIWSWLNRQDPYALSTPWSSVSFMAAWVRGLAQRVARGQAAPLLAAPTHSGGWIDPPVLVKRFRERCKLRVADELEDLILAILRLAPDHRASALAAAGDLYGEQGAAIRYALGSNDETIGPTASLWVAAARSRAPWDDDPAVEARHPGRGPDAGQAAAYNVDGNVMLKRISTDAILDVRRQPEIPESLKTASDLPTVTGSRSASLWPMALESFCAQGAVDMLCCFEASHDWGQGQEYLSRLADPDVPLRPMARLLLALCLNAKGPELGGLATDVLVAGIDDGRLDAETLGKSLRLVWQMRVETWDYRTINRSLLQELHAVAVVKPARWVRTLGNAARVSPLHARVIAGAVEHFLTDEATGTRTTSSLIPLLELVREASVETGRAVSAEFRAYLGTVGSGGKTGRVVKDLLALCDVPDRLAWRAARTQALARRIARAERWTAWVRSSS